MITLSVRIRLPVPITGVNMLVDNDQVLPVKNLTALEESKIEFAKHIDILLEIIKTTEWNVGDTINENNRNLFDTKVSLEDAIDYFNSITE